MRAPRRATRGTAVPGPNRRRSSRKVMAFIRARASYERFPRRAPILTVAVTPPSSQTDSVVDPQGTGPPQSTETAVGHPGETIARVVSNFSPTRPADSAFCEEPPPCCNR